MSWLDVYLGNYEWYRKWTKVAWYKHEFTPDAEDLSFPRYVTFWAKYPQLNRYSKVISFKNYSK